MKRFAILFAVILLVLFALELTAPGQAIVKPWTQFVASTSSELIRAFDGDAKAKGIMLYSERTGFAVTIEAGCNGVEAMLVLLAGILAFPAPWRHKFIGLAIGAVAIQALNILRVVSLFYLGQWDRQWFDWAHLYVWQSLIMLDAMIVWLLWIRAIPARSSSVAA
ncbi:MAG TPA: exosortase H [Usitatibacteraceae bacterium]|nr:exosortase H [Usitatibacteraceae bacterium]